MTADQQAAEQPQPIRYKTMAIEFNGRVYKSTTLGFILVFLTLVACFVLWMMGRGDLTLALIAALAVAYLIG